jgi:hypothetical protein
MTSSKLVGLALALSLFAAGSAEAAESFPGVTYAVETYDGKTGHVVRIDRCRANVKVRVTSESDRYKTVEDFAKATGALVAINASYFDPYYEPNPAAAMAQGKANGVTISDGVPWSRVYASLEAYGGWSDDVGDLRLLRTTQARPASVTQAAAAFFSVRNGVACDGSQPAVCDTFSSSRTKRTIFGVDETRSTIFFAAIENVSPPEASRFAVKMGAYDALNYDSGGSTALYVKGEGYKVATSRHVINAIVATPSTTPTCAPPTEDAGADATPGGDAGAPRTDAGGDGGARPTERAAPAVEDDARDESPGGCSSAGSSFGAWTGEGGSLVALAGASILGVLAGLRRRARGRRR